MNDQLFDLIREALQAAHEAGRVSGRHTYDHNIADDIIGEQLRRAQALETHATRRMWAALYDAASDAAAPAPARKIAAQVAVEAIANDPAAYGDDTIEAVRQEGVAAGVATLYLEMIPAKAV